jgi:hypothetical protein
VRQARARAARRALRPARPASFSRAPQIQPDGHCLFSAIADQLALLSLIPESAASYTTTRKTASELMRAHPDDFIPFLPSIAGEDGSGATDDGLMNPAQFGTYCERIAGTAQWGGEPEIQALARAYAVPIHVVQGGEPRIVVHEPGGPARSVAPVLISYHRRMYGLGEVRAHGRTRNRADGRVALQLAKTEEARVPPVGRDGRDGLVNQRNRHSRHMYNSRTDTIHTGIYARSDQQVVV